MEPYENFKPRCSITEANNIVEQTTPDIGWIALECYVNAYEKESHKYPNDTIWIQNYALASVYMLGFLSGSRAIRERKKPPTAMGD